MLCRQVIPSGALWLSRETTAQARATVAEFLDRLGYDVVDAGMLASARTFATGTPIFEGHWQRDEMKRLLDAPAERPLVSLVS